MPDGIKGVLAAVISALALSSMGIFGKLLYRYEVEPLNVVTLRALIAALTLGLILLLVRRRWPHLERRHTLIFLLLGLIGIACNYASFFLALKATNIATAIMLLYSYPAFVLLGSVIFLGERLTGRKLAALTLTLTGCLLIMHIHDPDSLILNGWGIAFGLAASLTKAVYTLLGKKTLSHYDPWTAVFFAFSFGALFLTAYSLPAGLLEFDLPPTAWAYILAIAWIPTLIGYSLFVVALKYLEAGQASIIATLEPVTAIFLAALILGEAIDTPQIAGVILVLSGIILLQVRRRPVDTAASPRPLGSGK